MYFVNGKVIELDPVHMYPYSPENVTFFLRFQKKFASTRSVFASFLPVHTYPPSQAWRISVRYYKRQEGEAPVRHLE